jgi:hypothetical protein
MEEGIAAVKAGRSDTIQVEYNLLMQEPAEKIFPLQKKPMSGLLRVCRSVAECLPEK